MIMESCRIIHWFQESKTLTYTFCKGAKNIFVNLSTCHLTSIEHLSRCMLYTKHEVCKDLENMCLAPQEQSLAESGSEAKGQIEPGWERRWEKTPKSIYELISFLQNK